MAIVLVNWSEGGHLEMASKCWTLWTGFALAVAFLSASEPQTATCLKVSVRCEVQQFATKWE